MWRAKYWQVSPSTCSITKPMISEGSVCAKDMQKKLKRRRRVKIPGTANRARLKNHKRCGLWTWSLAFAGKKEQIPLTFFFSSTLKKPKIFIFQIYTMKFASMLFTLSLLFALAMSLPTSPVKREEQPMIAIPAPGEPIGNYLSRLIGPIPLVGGLTALIGLPPS